MFKTLNIDQIRDIMNSAYEINGLNMLPDKVIEVLSCEASLVGSSVEFMLPHLLAAVSSKLGHTTVQSFDTFKKGVTLFDILVAYPATGKSVALQIIIDALLNVESELSIDMQHSALTSAVTVENIHYLLAKQPVMLGYYNEGFSLLSSAGCSEVANRSDANFFHNLFSTPEMISKETPRSRTVAIKPRFNITCNGFPMHIINRLRKEKLLSEDHGMLNFLVSAPRPPMCYSYEIRNSESIVSLASLFYLIHMLHDGKERNYTFTPDAVILLDNHYNLYKRRAGAVLDRDVFLAAILNKTHPLVIRLATVIHVLNYCIRKLLPVKDANSKKLTKRFKEEVELIIKQFDGNQEHFLIDDKIVLHAIHAMEYFNHHKLMLSAYLVEPHHIFSEVYTSIFMDLHRTRRAPEFCYESPIQKRKEEANQKAKILRNIQRRPMLSRTLEEVANEQKVSVEELLAQADISSIEDIEKIQVCPEELRSEDSSSESSPSTSQSASAQASPGNDLSIESASNKSHITISDNNESMRDNEPSPLVLKQSETIALKCLPIAIDGEYKILHTKNGRTSRLL